MPDCANVIIHECVGDIVSENNHVTVAMFGSATVTVLIRADTVA